LNLLVLSSHRRGSGKTTLALGIGLNALERGKSVGYLKPLGNKPVYSEGKIWDKDSELISEVLNLNRKKENLSIGFDYEKLRYSHGDLLKELKSSIWESDVFLIECGSISSGSYFNLDPTSITRELGGRAIFVLDGNREELLDQSSFLRKLEEEMNLKIEIVINKAEDPYSIKGEMEELGLDPLGVIPKEETLETITPRRISEELNARIIAGETGLDNEIRHIFIGAMSATEAMKNPLFYKKDKLIITGGDRVDMILAAIESETSCLVLTNNILPPPNVISRASEEGVPLLLVPWDTYTTATKIERIEPTVYPEEKEKIRTIREIVEEHVSLDRILS